MPTIEPATPTGRYVLEEWENEGGPDPQMRKAILAIEAEAAAPAEPAGHVHDPDICNECQEMVMEALT